MTVEDTYPEGMQKRQGVSWLSVDRASYFCGPPWWRLSEFGFSEDRELERKNGKSTSFSANESTHAAATADSCRDCYS